MTITHSNKDHRIAREVLTDKNPGISPRSQYRFASDRILHAEPTEERLRNLITNMNRKGVIQIMEILRDIYLSEYSKERDRIAAKAWLTATVSVQQIVSETGKPKNVRVTLFFVYNDMTSGKGILTLTNRGRLKELAELLGTPQVEEESQGPSIAEIARLTDEGFRDRKEASSSMQEMVRRSSTTSAIVV